MGDDRCKVPAARKSQETVSDGREDSRFCTLRRRSTWQDTIGKPNSSVLGRAAFYQRGSGLYDTRSCDNSPFDGTNGGTMTDSPRVRSVPAALMLVFGLSVTAFAQTEPSEVDSFEIRIVDVQQGHSQLIIFPSRFSILS